MRTQTRRLEIPLVLRNRQLYISTISSMCWKGVGRIHISRVLVSARRSLYIDLDQHCKSK